MYFVVQNKYHNVLTLCVIMYYKNLDLRYVFFFRNSGHCVWRSGQIVILLETFSNRSFKTFVVNKYLLIMKDLTLIENSFYKHLCHQHSRRDTQGSLSVLLVHNCFPLLVDY